MAVAVVSEPARLVVLGKYAEYIDAVDANSHLQEGFGLSFRLGKPVAYEGAQHILPILPVFAEPLGGPLLANPMKYLAAMLRVWVVPL